MRVIDAPRAEHDRTHSNLQMGPFTRGGQGAEPEYFGLPKRPLFPDTFVLYVPSAVDPM